MELLSNLFKTGLSFKTRNTTKPNNEHAAIKAATSIPDILNIPPQFPILLIIIPLSCIKRY